MAACEATSTHTVTIQNAVGVVNYEWSVTPNAYIISQLGVELLPNTAYLDTTGLVAIGGSLLTVANGILYQEVITNANPFFKQTIPVEIGKTYLVSQRMRKGTSNTQNIKIVNDVANDTLSEILSIDTVEWKTYQMQFTATETSIEFRSGMNAAVNSGQIAEYTEPSIREIIGGVYTPETVTVGTTDEAFVTFDLTCLVTDENANSIHSSTFTHTRVPSDPTNENLDTFYIMDKALVSGAIVDEAVSDPVSDGTLHVSGGGAWTPTAEEYPQDGTIELTGGNYIEIPHEFSAIEEWQFIRCYDIHGRNFRIMVIIYAGDGTASFMYGDQDNYPTLLDQNTTLPYTPKVGNYQIVQELDVPATEITYEMDSFSGSIEHTYNMDAFTTI